MGIDGQSISSSSSLSAISQLNGREYSWRTEQSDNGFMLWVLRGGVRQSSALVVPYGGGTAGGCFTRLCPSTTGCGLGKGRGKVTAELKLFGNVEAFPYILTAKSGGSSSLSRVVGLKLPSDEVLFLGFGWVDSMYKSAGLDAEPFWNILVNKDLRCRREVIFQTNVFSFPTAIVTAHAHNYKPLTSSSRLGRVTRGASIIRNRYIAISILYIQHGDTRNEISLKFKCLLKH